MAFLIPLTLARGHHLHLLEETNSEVYYIITFNQSLTDDVTFIIGLEKNVFTYEKQDPVSR